MCVYIYMITPESSSAHGPLRIGTLVIKADSLTEAEKIKDETLIAENISPKIARFSGVVNHEIMGFMEIYKIKS